MITKDGVALAHYILRNSSRYIAGTFDFNEGCWVLVADGESRDKRGYPSAFAPITDFTPYLAHARRSPAQFPRDLVCLLEAWADQNRDAPGESTLSAG